MLNYNPILAIDSYKLSHALAYPDYVKGMYSYIEPRTQGDIIVPFGYNIWIQKYLKQSITMDHIDEAEAFAALHGEPFARNKWEYIVNKYNGFAPISIFAVPEGTPVPSGNVILSVECTDPEVFWYCSFVETQLLRAVWYPSTITTMDYAIKKLIKRYYELSGADMAMLPFALHDFGGRGVTSAEQAEIGGAAHLVNFMGSDTIEGIRAANYYYKNDMAGFSVPATEHSVECSFGLDVAGERAYLDNVLTKLAKPGGIVSIVIDGRDTFRCAEMLCTEFRDRIVASGCKVVFRPDSGNMLEVVPRLLKLQEAAFGVTVNAKGYKKPNYVGILQGDGVDHFAINQLLVIITSLGYSADSVVFGSGGALLQKVNRDTFKWAMKASAILVDGDWVGIAKDPITDPDKASKKGRVALVRSRMTGQLSSYTIDGLHEEFDNEMICVYHEGMLMNLPTLDQVRARCAL